ncbi:MAG: 1-acyl-sn-glycerol-3-phosphate acyltransferase [Candidatus Pedobacter colombiensis]|uniref:1-acyl-sn-glycerol-3-phosphate acyltransferase n=1 Tax=Candidatus Pedobacter colombiensis TaxID=3121371 RepID=A0AAJ6B9Z5_9SPHI|nr:1-acyl-sn-glycerol-3-phosphate acyltransferase [Pedobacter sp.]WEK20733.1 MAG: 1-acyl-sn-glycerol-3-phosphate acyltransferase [Pedobacter sp.]
MIIKAKPLNPFFFKCGAILIGWFLKRRFNKILIKDIEINPDSSYLLMCNHFSFLDGLLAYYLCNKVLWKKNGMKRLYIMSLKKQMEKNKWLRYCGSFSIDPGKRSIAESFDYATEILSKPGNVLLFYPQGNLESSHIRYIQFQDGLREIVPNVKGRCQLIWSSNLIEYFESTKPSLYYNLLDCGSNEEFDFDSLKQQVNLHHRKSIEKNIRFTEEPISYSAT